MTTRKDQPGSSLEESLSRIEQVLEREVEPAIERFVERGRTAAERAAKEGRVQVKGGGSVLAMAAALVVLAAVTGAWWLLAPAVLLSLVSAALFAWPLINDLLFLTPAPPGESGTTRIGPGVSIDESARVDAGAALQAGAVVREGALVESGALVGMGAVVERDAVVRRNARLGWGAVVKEGAEIGEGAVIGTGAVVKEGVKVQPGSVLGVGAVVSAATGRNLPAGKATARPAEARPAAPADPRDARVDAVCDRLMSELRDASSQVRSFLGRPEETVTALRRTSHELLRRERLLRAEVSPDERERIEGERRAIEERIASESDEVIRQRLRGAVEAIDEQLRQRDLLQRNASRLEAEHTRLQWTLEGLLSQVIRLRSEGLAATDAAVELDRSLTRLSDEVNAVAGALEEVSSAGATPRSAVEPVAFEDFSGAPASRGRDRTRE